MDKRTENAKNKLKNTLIELINKKDISEVSVIELCKMSKVNRSTFYKYYTIPEDILIEYIEKLKNEFQERAKKENVTNIKELIRLSCEIIYKEKNLYIVWGKSLSKLIDIYMDNFNQYQEFSTVKVNKSQMLFISAGYSALLLDWLKNDNIGVDEFVDIIYPMLLFKD